MKKTYFLLFFVGLFSLGVITAQEPTFTLEPLEVQKGIDVNPEKEQDFEIHNVFTNTADETKTYIWERTVLYKPKDWETAICDVNRCYLPNVYTEDFEIEAGESFDMIPHAYNNFTDGDSVIIELKVYEEGNPDNSRTATYTFTTMTTATENVKRSKELILYPNPTTHNFQLKTTELVDEVVVHNILGSSVKKFDAREGRLYDVGDLQNGIYFVRLIDGDGEVETTLRLNKE